MNVCTLSFYAGRYESRRKMNELMYVRNTEGWSEKLVGVVYEEGFELL